MSEKRSKRISLGDIELAISLDARQVERIKSRVPYRYVVKPAVDLLANVAGRRNRHPNGTSGQDGASGSTLSAAPPPTTSSVPRTPEAQAIYDRIKDIEWYHSIELPHGVVTPGFTDHRGQLHLYDLPVDMRGLRALDVATYDGFWAFEMERRGADVVSIDIGSWSQFDIPLHQLEEWRKTGEPDKPTGRGFQTAHEILGSRVQRHVLSVYELAPDKVGAFDVVFLSDLLLHLRDPQRALENVFSVVRPDGFAIIADVHNPRLVGFHDETITEFVGFGAYVWWLPSVATLKKMMSVAGFRRIDEIARFTLAATANDPIHKVVLRGYPAP